MISIEDYKKIVGNKEIQKLKKDALPLKGKHIIHFNSTYYGGGVAEILNHHVILMNQLGIKTGWRIIKGNSDFFNVTKKFHNGLQGEKTHLTRKKIKNYEEVNKVNSLISHIEGHDAVIIHDPQPLPLIKYYKKEQPWIWRCHIDITDPDMELWDYLSGYIEKYDEMIVSKKEYIKKLDIRQSVIYPAIDPLNNTNRELSEGFVKKYLKKYEIPTDKPIICQISRFDKWKDPVGVIEAFKLIRKEIDCRLVLFGSMATDDPEGQEIFEEVTKHAQDMEDILVISFEDSFLVNALQRYSSVVIQKSIREGFGLTVAEALWKKTPVVAGNVGGIPLQINHGETGYLVDSVEECAAATIKLLKNPKNAKEMGEKGYRHIKEKFLVTRHLRDYLKLLKRHLV